MAAHLFAGNFNQASIEFTLVRGTELFHESFGGIKLAGKNFWGK
jgi:hypothetical protein